MRLTLKSVQEQAASEGVNVEKTSKGYAVNGQTFRLLAEVVNYVTYSPRRHFVDGGGF